MSILGGKGKNMPSFGDKLSKSQARDLVAYLRALDLAAEQVKPSSIVPAGASLTDFDKKFQELQEELKVLQRQFYQLSSPPKKP